MARGSRKFIVGVGVFALALSFVFVFKTGAAPGTGPGLAQDTTDSRAPETPEVPVKRQCYPPGVDAAAAEAATPLQVDITSFMTDGGEGVPVIIMRAKPAVGEDFVIVVNGDGVVIIYDPKPDEPAGAVWKDAGFVDGPRVRSVPGAPCQWQLRAPADGRRDLAPARDLRTEFDFVRPSGDTFSFGLSRTAVKRG